MKTLHAVSDRSWTSSALCRNPKVDHAWFFSQGGNDRVHRALDICAACTVRKQCLEFALATDAQGVWGGTTDIDRQRMKRRAS